MPLQGKKQWAHWALNNRLFCAPAVREAIDLPFFILTVSGGTLGCRHSSQVWEEEAKGANLRGFSSSQHNLDCPAILTFSGGGVLLHYIHFGNFWPDWSITFWEDMHRLYNTIDNKLPICMQYKYTQIHRHKVFMLNTLIIVYYNSNNTCTNRLGHRQANSYKHLPSTKSNWELPEISQHGTTSLTWPFNDAYKSRLGERWVKIPQNEKKKPKHY